MATYLIFALELFPYFADIYNPIYSNVAQIIVH